MADRRFLYPPDQVLVECNRQLHGVGDLIEYFADSRAIACRIRLARWFSTTNCPNVKNIIPPKRRAKPPPTNGGNPPECELPFDDPPAMKSAIPPMTIRAAISPTRIRDVRDDIV